MITTVTSDNKWLAVSRDPLSRLQRLSLMTKIGELELSFEQHTEKVNGADRIEKSINVSNKLGKPFFEIKKNYISGGQIISGGKMIAEYDESTYPRGYTVIPYENSLKCLDKKEEIHPLDYIVRLLEQESTK